MSYSESFQETQVEITDHERLRLIFSYVTSISEEKDLSNLLMLMADLGKQLIQAKRCSLWLLDEENEELWTMVAHGVDELRIPYGTGFVGYAIDSGKSVIIEDAYEDDRFNRDVDKQTGYRTRSILVIPIRDSNDEIIGAYQAVNKMTEENCFTSEDEGYLELAASYSGKAIESAILYNEIERTQKEIIFRMGEIGESRSRETANHVKRVAEYSRVLAIGLGMDEDEADLIKMASPMHDIGKVGIPDSILNKPGKLTDDEFKQMQYHTEDGYKLLKDSPRKILKTAAVIAHEHHEKFNGKGYPRGISGKNIHIYGRITAVADVFDALASDRVYKPAWPLEKVIKVFKEEQGEHFDPKLINVFFDNLEEILDIKEKYDDKFDA